MFREKLSQFQKWIRLHQRLSIVLVSLVFLLTSTIVAYTSGITHLLASPQDCGKLSLVTIRTTAGQGENQVIANGETSFRAEQCFLHAYQHCLYASITYSALTGVDTSNADTLTIVKQYQDCVIADLSTSTVDVMQRSSTQTCRGLSLQTDGLHITGCDNGVSWTIPPVTSIDCGSVGDGTSAASTTESEKCFWDAYQQSHAATMTSITTPNNGWIARYFNTDNHRQITEARSDQNTKNTCASLTQEADGLHFSGCGTDGNVVVAAR